LSRERLLELPEIRGQLLSEASAMGPSLVGGQEYDFSLGQTVGSLDAKCIEAFCRFSSCLFAVAKTAAAEGLQCVMKEHYV
jgi:hypothetical protein